MSEIDGKPFAWKLGAGRRVNGGTFDENPYPPETDQYDRDLWALGWRWADYEEKVKVPDHVISCHKIFTPMF